MISDKPFWEASSGSILTGYQHTKIGSNRRARSERPRFSASILHASRFASNTAPAECDTSNQIRANRDLLRPAGFLTLTGERRRQRVSCYYLFGLNSIESVDDEPWGKSIHFNPTPWH